MLDEKCSFKIGSVKYWHCYCSGNVPHGTCVVHALENNSCQVCQFTQILPCRAEFNDLIWFFFFQLLTRLQIPARTIPSSEPADPATAATNAGSPCSSSWAWVLLLPGETPRAIPGRHFYSCQQNVTAAQYIYGEPGSDCPSDPAETDKTTKTKDNSSIQGR